MACCVPKESMLLLTGLEDGGLTDDLATISTLSNVVVQQQPAQPLFCGLISHRPSQMRRGLVKA